jgi:hypothetical protein
LWSEVSSLRDSKVRDWFRGLTSPAKLCRRYATEGIQRKSTTPALSNDGLGWGVRMLGMGRVLVLIYEYG